MSRIINRQRQLAEQGRLRLGYTVPATKKDGTPTTRPVRSETWIITSHSRDHVETAAALWGGEAQQWEPMGNGATQWRVITTTNAIPAILPHGDPLTQSYEQWNRGGCVRRCDGATEQFSGSPCICLAQHGEQWYELSSRMVCSSKSRLKVFLPDMPGLGSWRMETGSFYATDEIAGMVDIIRGAVGPDVLVPVTLRIEPRTRVAGGETKQFVVPVVELRGVTAGALLSGQAIETGALRGAGPRRALEAGGADQQAADAGDAFTPLFDQVAAARTLDDLADIWHQGTVAKLIGPDAAVTDRSTEFFEVWRARAKELKTTTQTPPQPQPAAQPATAVDDEAAANAVWQEVLDAAGRIGMALEDVTADYAQWSGGVIVAEATSTELRRYLDQLGVPA